MSSVESAGEADLAAVIELVHWAKLSLTINRLLWNEWPNKEAQKEQTTQHVEHSFRDPGVKTLKVADEASGELLGFIILTQRRSTKVTDTGGKQDSDTEKRPKLSNQLNPAVLSLVDTGLSEIRDNMAGVDYIEVTSINVTQSSRRRGIGKQLMNAAFKYARSEDLPLFVTSEPEAQGFFDKLGMREIKHVDMDLSKYAPPYTGFGLFRMIGMVWSPNE